MNVVNEVSIVAQVNLAIHNAESAGQTISHIELTAVEMRAFLENPRFRQVRSSDMAYGDISMPFPTDISGVDSEADVPRSCVYRGVRIVLV
jgi:hypothetical protein